MRCQACDIELTDREATRKYAERNEYIDMCHKCTVESGILYRENPFLTDKHDDEEPLPQDDLWEVDHAH